MTLRDKVTAYLGFEPSREAVESALNDSGFTDITADYVPENYPGVAKATIKLIDIILTTANASNTITGYTHSYDRQALLKYRNYLAAQLGLPEIDNPIISAPRVW